MMKIIKNYELIAKIHEQSCATMKNYETLWKKMKIAKHVENNENDEYTDRKPMKHHDEKG